MTSSMLPPNPSLVAIILIIKTGLGGPRRVFHYPPNPGHDNPHVKLDYEDSSTDDSSSSGDDIYSGYNDSTGSGNDDRGGYSSLEDDTSLDNQRPKAKTSKRPIEPYTDESGSASPEKNDGISWEKGRNEDTGLLGLPNDLPHLLCPPPTAHQKKFELSIGGWTFLGRPVFARENGEWKRKKPKKPKVSKDPESAHQQSAELPKKTVVQEDEHLAESSGYDSIVDEDEATPYDEAAEALEALRIQELSEKWEQEKTEQSWKEVLNMFHVVFVLDPPPLEHQVRVNDMYKHVVKKFSRALKWEQARADYVLKQSLKMRAVESSRDCCMKGKIRESSLAKAIEILYKSISTSRIAHMNLTPTRSFSLQIPIPTSISILPTPTSPQLPGLWLTTATSIAGDDEVQTTGSQLAAHFALLLLSDLPAILADVNATGSPIAAPLTHYLRVSTPTKSFLQISQSSGIPLGDIQFMASHLIYWRRARAVPPLHQKDTYIVSPNADMKKLRSMSVTYSRLFPSLPALPKMLNMLSTTPRPYSTLIPSKDHKEPYLEILAWLMRGGWITQLRTFAWVRVSADIQNAVAREMEDEERDNKPRPSTSDREGEEHDRESDKNNNTDNNTLDDDAGEPDLPSGYLSPPHSLFSSRSRSRSSTSSNRTAIPLSQTTPSPSSKTHPLPPIFILNPTRASGIDSRYLSAISAEMLSAHGQDVHNAWHRCLKYINGQHALEKIAVREGWKRKRVAELLAGWRGVGVLLEVRHW